ncbi:acyltransferase family protein [bacterium]|nr:acyltransferase family protein [bacterium]
MDGTKKNFLNIDYAKVFGIYLVILGHFLRDFHIGITLSNFIYMFHMPLFFVISGFLYKQKTKEENYNIIITRLLIPYFLYQFLYLPIKAIYLSVSGDMNIFIVLLKSLAGIMIGDCYGTRFSILVCSVCWFLLTMIYIRLIFANIKLSKINLITLSIASIILLKILFILKFDLIFCIDNLLYTLPYFIMGYYFKEYIYPSFSDKKNLLSNNFIKILLFVLSFSAVYLILKTNGLIECNMKINHLVSQRSILLSYIGGLAGTVGVILFSDLIKKDFKFIQVISKNTLFIMFFHVFILLISKVAGIIPFAHKYFQGINLFIFVIIYGIVMLIFSYYTILFLEKKCPILLGKTKKKNNL